MTDDLRYPIGKFISAPYSESLKEEWLAAIQFLPQAIEYAIANLDEAQLQTPYRDGGWTVHQLVHHIADSHMHAYIRFKIAHFEDGATIKPYDENLWAGTTDVQNLPVNISLTLLHALHRRWHEFIKNLNSDDFQRTIFHPEHQKTFTIWHLLGLYAWHGRHHTAHITALRERKGWS